MSEYKKSTRIYKTKYNVLMYNIFSGQILDKIRIVDPNDSDAVKECVTVFFRNLPKHSEHNRWLRALDDVLRRYNNHKFHKLYSIYNVLL